VPYGLRQEGRVEEGRVHADGVQALKLKVSGLTLP